MSEDAVNWLLLAEIVVIVIVTSAFLFYWNRLFASVFAFLVRLITWRKYNAYISIGSLQISTLAGRISFRDVEYHSSNLSVRALHGHITWRYWKLRVRQEDDNPKNNHLPCRISIFAEGVEGFVFNRTPAYDAIVERMKKHEGTAETSATPEQKGAKLRKAQTRTSEERSSNDSYPPKPKNPIGPGHDLPYSPKPITEEVSGVSWIREALPFELRIETGSFVLGSDATPMVLIGDFKTAQGIVEVTDSRSPCDYYKLSYGMNFQDVKLLMRTNVDYSGALLAHGKKAYDQLLRQRPELSQEPPSKLSISTGFRLLARQFPFLYNPKFSSPPVAGLPQDRPWKGLARYRQISAPQAPHKQDREYAKVTTLLDSPSVDFTYYADTPGQVPFGSHLIDEFDEVGNVEPPPEYGMDIVIHGGLVKYGPWADRQRDALQRAFAPSIFFDSDPKPRLQPGDLRIHTTMILNLQMSEDTTLRIPTREPSKDWMYDNQSVDAERRYGWLDVNIGANSSIIYTQAQIATKHGYDAMLALHLDSLEIASSVNLETFIKAKTCKLSMTMPTPLRWDAQRDWGLDVTLDSPDINLLRDHVTLISDLSRDWSSGATGDFHHFVPNHYKFRVSLLNYAIHLNINDYNIVDRPKSRADNAFMDIFGPRLDAYVAVAATQYRPEFSVVPFSVKMSDARVELCVPKWDTHRASEGALEVGRIGDLTARGSYRYYSAPRPDHQEALTLHLDGERVVFKALGWVIRRLFSVKDNYFGSFTQFTTIQEYLERFDHDSASVGDPVEEKYRPGRSDSFTVQVTMDIRESLVVMSDAIYSYDQGVVIPVPKLQMSLKSTEFFMELSLDALPTYVIASEDLNASYKAGVAPPIPMKAGDVIFVEGIEVKANRLFGPQPRATTYLCLWEMSISSVSAFLSPAMASTLRGLQVAFGYSFTDVDNAPASIYIPKTPPDVTFFKFSIDKLVATYTGTDHSAMIELPSGLTLDTSSLAGRTYGSMIGVLIPSATVQLVTTNGTIVGRASFGLAVDVFNAAPGWQDKASRQQAFITEQDRDTKRISFMYNGEPNMGGDHVHGMYLPRPTADPPDDYDTEESEDGENQDTKSSSETESEEQVGTPLTGRRHRMKRRSRSFATARDSMTESDTSSTASSSSSVTDQATGMLADALAARLRYFKSLNHDTDSSSFAWRPTKPRPLVDAGKVIRISTKDIFCEATSESVAAVLDIVDATTAWERRPELVLDSLLDGHTDHVLDVSSPSSLILDIAIPAVDIVLPSKSLSLHLMLRQTSCSITRTPWAHQEEKSTSLRVDVSTDIRVTATGTASTNLRDIGGMPLDGVVDISVMGFQLDLLQDPRQNQIHGEVRGCDIHAVTPAISLVNDSISTWQHALQVPRHAIRPPASGQILYSILKTAMSSGVSTSQPAFVYESAYGLHVDDSRNIRRDLGWMMVSRFRHWLSSGMTLETAPEQEMANFVVRQMSEMEYGEANEELVRSQAFLRAAFGSSLLLDHPQASNRQINLCFALSSMVVRHHGPSIETGKTVSSIAKVEAASIGLLLAPKIQQYRIVIAVQLIDIDLKDSIFSVVEPVLGIVHPTSVSADVSESPAKSPNATVVFDSHLSTVNVSILAGGVKLQAGIKGASSAGTIRKRLTDTRFITTCAIDSAELAALQPSQQDNTERKLISASMEGFRSLADSGPKQYPRLQLVIGIKHADMDSRPQLRAFYDFGQDWKDTQYPRYQHVIEKILHLQSSQPSKPTAMPDHVIDFKLGSAKIQIRAAKELWLRWDIGEIFLTHQGSRSDIQFGSRVAPQVVGAYPSPRKAKARDSSSLHLPSISAIGTHRKVSDRDVISAKVNFGFFTGTLKPAVLDRLLSLHQRMGGDMVEVVQDYKSGLTCAMGKSESTPKLSPLFDLHLTVEGIRFGLRADDVTTTLLFEALALDGHATNQSNPEAALQWRAKVDHFGLSLGHLGTSQLSADAEPMRKSRSAYMVLDIDVHETPSKTQSQLSVALKGVHTVMHVAALSELADLIRSWTRDISTLNDHRADEVAEVKLQTNKVLKKFEPEDRAAEPSWFASRLLTVEVTGFGIAIPLTEGAIELQPTESVPALLYSIRVISFSNRRNETARFRVQQMALQFLEKFDQGIVEHFTGDFHPSSNRMILPSIDAKAQMLTTQDKWCLSAHCSATDFKLALTPDVADGIFRLTDLYEHGRAGLAEFDKQYKSEMAKRETDHVEPSPASRHNHQRIVVRMSFTFNSGIVELHRPLSESDKRSMASDLRGRPGRLGWHDTFHLPTISLWMDYAETEGSTGDDDRALLLFNAAVHESRNILRPSILPFFVEIVNKIDRRVKEVVPSEPISAERKAEILSSPVLESTLQAAAEAPTGRVRLQVTLRIDRSELRLSCAPDSDAYVDLKWESGGFLVSTLLGGEDVTTLAGTVSGVTAYLSHEFAEQGRSCIEAGARDMSFSLALCTSGGKVKRGLSVVVDTQVSAQFRLEAFSAWLIFSAVWLDNAPKFDIPLRTGIAEAAAPPQRIHNSKLVTVALVRFRSVDFDTHIAVTKAKLEMTPVVVRTLSNGERTEVDVSIGTTEVIANGDISGDIRSDSLTFNTVRRSSRAGPTTDPTVLEMAIDGGDLHGNLFLGDTNIVRFHLEPSKVTLADDWKAFSLDPSAQVFLAFAVKAGNFQGVLRLLHIPRLLGNLYSIFDMVESQNKIATQRSEAFKGRQIRKASEPSQVAVLLQTSQRGSHSSNQVKTAQTMRFDLSGIDIGVFNEDLDETAAFYRFLVGKVEADLKRYLTKEGLSGRDLSLLATFMRWETSDGNRGKAGERRDMTAKELIDMASKGGQEVASLPLMTLTMTSVQLPDPPTLEYTFNLIWGDSDGDVAVWPNFFEKAFKAFQNLIKGLDAQQVARARRLGIVKSSPKHSKGISEEIPATTLIYRERQGVHAGALPVPRLKILGEGTGDAAKLVPKLTTAVNELPSMSHRFVTLPLEEGMDLLLKLYEKQLPDSLS